MDAGGRQIWRTPKESAAFPDIDDDRRTVAMNPGYPRHPVGGVLTYQA
jgi:hypothetical protein